MDTSAEINQELRNATVERKKQGGQMFQNIWLLFCEPTKRIQNLMNGFQRQSHESVLLIFKRQLKQSSNCPMMI